MSRGEERRLDAYRSYVRRRLDERGRGWNRRPCSSRDDRDASRGRLSASRRSGVARHSRDSVLFVSSCRVGASPRLPSSRNVLRATKNGFLWRWLADDAVRVASTSRRRRHAAPLCARSRPGTSHVDLVCVFNHRTHECMYSGCTGGYIKSGWI